MLIARKLVDTFMNSLKQADKDHLYDLAMVDLDSAMAKFSSSYEVLFGDYPTGFVAALMQQHLKDKIFQKTVTQTKVA